MQDGILRICEPMASVRLQGGQLPRHAGEVTGRVPGYVLWILGPHSASVPTSYATRACVWPPERLRPQAAALSSPTPPRPSEAILAPLRAPAPPARGAGSQRWLRVPAHAQGQRLAGESPPPAALVPDLSWL